MSMQFPLHNPEQHIPNITRKERKEYRTLLPSQRLPSRDTDAAIVSLIIPGISVRSYEIQVAVLLLFHGKNRNKQLPHFYQYGKCLFFCFLRRKLLFGIIYMMASSNHTPSCLPGSLLVYPWVFLLMLIFAQICITGKTHFSLSFSHILS